MQSYISGEWEPVCDLKIWARDASCGENRVKILVFGVRIEKTFGAIVHLLLFLSGNTHEGCTFWGGVLAIFDFSEENLLVFDGNKVDFVGFSLEIVSENLVILAFEVASNRFFGSLTFLAGRRRFRFCVVPLGF